MSVQITIRNVPEQVREELAVRAARKRQSMQEYLLSELIEATSRPTKEEWLDRVRARKEASRTRITAAEILKARDADRSH